MTIQIQRLLKEYKKQQQIGKSVLVSNLMEPKKGFKRKLSREDHHNNMDSIDKITKQQVNIYKQRNTTKLYSSSLNSLNRQTNSLDSLLKIHKRSTPILLTLNMKRMQEKQTQLINLMKEQNINDRRLHERKTMTLTISQTPVNLSKGNIKKVTDQNFLKQVSKRLKNDIKGSAYGNSIGNRTPLSRSTFKKTLKMNRLPFSTLVSTKHKIQQPPNVLQKTQYQRSNQVKLSLNPAIFRNPSLTSISTPKSDESRNQSAKKRTLRFLQPSQDLSSLTSNKSETLEEFHQRLFENKEKLQEYITLCFNKLKPESSNHCQSTISLDEMKTENIDTTWRMNEVMNELNSLLESLRVHKQSFDEECFQREILIEAKISIYEMIKSKTRNETLTEILLKLLGDISLAKKNSKFTQLKKKMLYQLAENYFTIKQYKKSIEIYIQLTKLGESLCYLKIGEIYMLIKEYENSIRYHEMYATEKNYNLESKVKLAHAYSKVSQNYLKTIDMLTSLLIAPGSSAKFKQAIYERKYDDRLIESAVILLSSLHFKNDNVEKAIDLCESYSKINIKNYRVLHILAGYYRYNQNDRRAFQCYLNALQNNPTHHKSLIELTEFICYGTEYKTHAIQLLRKCFALENRNFELLSTLIKFLKNDDEKHKRLLQKIQKPQENCKTLVQYAQILKHSQSTGYWDRSLYQQATTVYEWALSLLEKNSSLENLQQIEQIYRNLGQICLKQDDYTKSEKYYKLYLIQIQKQVNSSCFIESKREQMIQNAKIEIYFFLGKVKKHQKSYKKAIQYFMKSHDLQLKYQVKLDHFESYFYLFELGYCYFYLEQYQMAITKFLQQKSYLLTLIAVQDQSFFKDEHQFRTEIPAYLMIQQVKIQEAKKINYLKEAKINQNQTSKNLPFQEDKQMQQIGKVLKRNFLENELHLAFCYDKLNRFIESKEIYKRILGFFKQAVNFIETKPKSRKEINKIEPKKAQNNERQLFFKTIISSQGQLNEDYTTMKRICLMNLTTIYKLEGIQNKYKQLAQQCRQLGPTGFQFHTSIQGQRESKDENLNNQIEQQFTVEKRIEITRKRKTTGGLLTQKERNFSAISLSELKNKDS